MDTSGYRSTLVSQLRRLANPRLYFRSRWCFETWLDEIACSLKKYLEEGLNALSPSLDSIEFGCALVYLCDSTLKGDFARVVMGGSSDDRRTIPRGDRLYAIPRTAATPGLVESSFTSFGFRYGASFILDD